MGDHGERRKGFYHMREAYYAESSLKVRDFEDEIMIGFYPKDGGTTGEFSIEWHRLNAQRLTPRLCVYDDAWDALMNMPELLKEMEKMDGTDPSPEKMRETLKRLGYIDLTPRVDPYSKVKGG